MKHARVLFDFEFELPTIDRRSGLRSVFWRIGEFGCWVAGMVGGVEFLRGDTSRDCPHGGYKWYLFSAATASQKQVPGPSTAGGPCRDSKWRNAKYLPSLSVSATTQVTHCAASSRTGSCQLPAPSFSHISRFPRSIKTTQPPIIITTTASTLHPSSPIDPQPCLIAAMRLTTSTVLLGAASAASAASFQQNAQHVLSGGFSRAQDAMRPFAETFANTRESFEEALKGMDSEAKALWDEIKLLIPEGAFDHSTWFSKPKPHRRRHDWDHVVKGEEVQKLWVQDTAGGNHREIDGRLEDFNLRVKSVDPSKLGIDTVKQYSGYLDDEANDKHLFYCEY